MCIRVFFSVSCAIKTWFLFLCLYSLEDFGVWMINGAPVGPLSQWIWFWFVLAKLSQPRPNVII